MFKEDKEMILISVKSPFMDIKHQEETDEQAEKWLKKTQKLHQLYLNAHLPKPSKRSANMRFSEHEANIIKYNEIKAECKMRIEIVNTEYTQLNLPL